MKYDYFRTSDGHLYAVPVKPSIPEWTDEQIELARRTIAAGVLLIQILVILVVLFLVLFFKYGLSE